MNENYEHPALPEGARSRHPEGHVPVAEGDAARRRAPRVQLLGSGTILREVIAGGRSARAGLGRSAPTSGAAQLHRAAPRRRWTSSAGTCCTRESRAGAVGRRSCLGDRAGPVIASTDYMQDVRRPDPRLRAEAAIRVLGTDGFGRSDYARKLRELLRGRPPLRGRRGAEGAGRRRRAGRAVAEAIAARPRRGCRSSATRSTPERRNPATQLKENRHGHANDRHDEVKVPDIGDFKDVPIIEIHVKAGRCRQRRGSADHSRVRQGDDGRARAARPARRRGAGQGRRPRQRGHADRARSRATRRARCSQPTSLLAQQEPATAAPPHAPRSGRAEPPASRAGGVRSGSADAQTDFCRRARRPACAARARTRRRSDQGDGHRRERPHHQRGRHGVPARPRPAPPARPQRHGAGIPEIPAQDFSKFGPIETRPLSRIKRISGAVPAPRLAQHPARHPERRGGHHRTRSLPQGTRRRRAKEKGYRVTLLAVPDEGVRLGLKQHSRSSTPRSRPGRTR